MHEETGSELRLFLSQTYQLYTEWFGIPIDARLPTVLVTGEFDACYRNRLLCEYTIVVRSDYESPEQRCAAIAHELYHRVTCRLGGLRRLQWLDEMLAFLASDHALRFNGMSEYADLRRDCYVNSTPRLTLAQAKRARSKRLALGFGGFRYPDGFGAAVALLGISLLEATTWSDIRSITRHRSWTDWLVSMPTEVRKRASQILELSADIEVEV
jgi:hypothetical protein